MKGLLDYIETEYVTLRKEKDEAVKNKEVAEWKSQGLISAVAKLQRWKAEVGAVMGDEDGWSMRAFAMGLVVGSVLVFLALLVPARLYQVWREGGEIPFKVKVSAGKWNE